MNLYITFGQNHIHRINNKIFDKDSICEIKCYNYLDGREIAFDSFGDKFATSYTENKISEILHLFPRGIIKLD